MEEGRSGVVRGAGLPHVRGPSCGAACRPSAVGKTSHLDGGEALQDGARGEAGRAAGRIDEGDEDVRRSDPRAPRTPTPARSPPRVGRSSRGQQIAALASADLTQPVPSQAESKCRGEFLGRYRARGCRASAARPASFYGRPSASADPAVGLALQLTQPPPQFRSCRRRRIPPLSAAPRCAPGRIPLLGAGGRRILARELQERLLHRVSAPSACPPDSAPAAHASRPASLRWECRSRPLGCSIFGTPPAWSGRGVPRHQGQGKPSGAISPPAESGRLSRL